MTEINDGHWTELIHAAYIAQELFNREVREHVLGVELEKAYPELKEKFETASTALYDVYNSIALKAPTD